MEEKELAWTGYYNRFIRKAKELRDVLDADFPEFTIEEELVLNEFCKSDDWFHYCLKEFYKRLYELITQIEEGKLTSRVRYFVDFGYIYADIIDVLTTRSFEIDEIKSCMDKIVITMSTIIDIVEKGKGS